MPGTATQSSFWKRSAWKLERLQAEQRELEAQVAEIQARNQRYEHILATLKRLQFAEARSGWTRTS